MFSRTSSTTSSSSRLRLFTARVSMFRAKKSRVEEEAGGSSSTADALRNRHPPSPELIMLADGELVQVHLQEQESEREQYDAQRDDDNEMMDDDREFEVEDEGGFGAVPVEMNDEETQSFADMSDEDNGYEAGYDGDDTDNDNDDDDEDDDYEQQHGMKVDVDLESPAKPEPISERGPSVPVWHRVYSYTEEVDCTSDEDENQQQQQQFPKPARKYDIQYANNTLLPAPRSGHTCALVETRTNQNSTERKMLMFGGFASRPLNKPLNDLWELNLETMEWKKIYDNVDGLSIPGATGAVMASTSSSSSSGDNSAPPSIPLPCPRVGHSGALSAKNKLIVFSGRNDVEGDFRDTWELDPETNTWTRLNCKGDRAPELILHSACCTKDNKMYVYGGWSRSIYDRVMVLDLTTNVWTELKTKGNAEPRERHSAVVYGNKMIVFGGHDNNKYMDDIAEFDLITHTWSQRKTYGDIPSFGIRSHTAVVDNIRRKMIVFGGKNSDTCISETYELDLETNRWKRLSNLMRGPVPEVRGRHTAVMDENRGQMIICSGTNGKYYYNDLYVCNFGTYARDIGNLFSDEL